MLYVSSCAPLELSDGGDQLARTVTLATQLINLSLVMTPSRRRAARCSAVTPIARRPGDMGNVASLTCDGRPPSCVITYCRTSPDVPTEGPHVSLGDLSFVLGSIVTYSRHGCLTFASRFCPVAGVLVRPWFAVSLRGPWPRRSIRPTLV